VSWRSMTAALAVPAFAWYWVGQLVSVIGTRSQVVAGSWLVLDLTLAAGGFAGLVATITANTRLQLLSPTSCGAGEGGAR
jgi:hypothetical protein